MLVLCNFLRKLMVSDKKIHRAFRTRTTLSYLPTFESQKTEHAILRGGEATKRKPKGGKPLKGGGCVPPPTVGSFCIFGLQNCAIWYSGAYLERKFRLKIYCIAWKATNLKIPKMERSVFWGFKNFKNRTVLLKKERLASLLYKQNPFEKFFIFTIYQNYTLALKQNFKWLKIIYCYIFKLRKGLVSIIFHNWIKL